MMRELVQIFPIHHHREWDRKQTDNVLDILGQAEKAVETRDEILRTYEPKNLQIGVKTAANGGGNHNDGDSMDSDDIDDEVTTQPGHLATTSLESSDDD